MFVPPFTFVTAPLGTPGFAGVPRPGLAETPPQGAIFCGSPSRFCAMLAAGEISTKCASTAPERLASVTAANTIRFLTTLLLVRRWSRLKRAPIVPQLRHEPRRRGDAEQDYQRIL